MKHRRFPLDIKKQFFTVRVTEHWHWLTWNVVYSPSLGDILKDIKHFLQEQVDGQHGRGNTYLPVPMTLSSGNSFVPGHKQ